MSYLTQPQTNNRQLTVIGIVALVHVFMIYALVTGLASDAYKKIVHGTEATQIKVEKPKEELPPPPPEKLQEIPVVMPPPLVQIQQDRPPPPTITAVQSLQTKVAPPTAPTQAPPPPPEVKPAPALKPSAPAVLASARGNNRALITNDDYPDSSLRAEEEGTTRVSYEINERGRVENCSVTQSSGHPRLDEATCTLITRRFKFNPAKAEGGQPVRETGHADAIKWVVPKDR